ncbi:single stranded DNA-binding protein [Brevibacillus aydinogluensis]|jgi:single-strand DNA-binding protein|uniref:single-stranded DNA-binding protein n=1 Tax=Brevibacillus aydinogluensis TaxID=927786 RepID=UPI002892FA57|nr:single-stranded DNA-binding protein [Brevibacillus aydinogluensis]MDT3417142.1 single stranded DNA-binding protein [Brevibacillus aydinogluensis]
MNSVNIIGRLTKDPELRHTTQNGKAVLNFDIAVDNGKDREPYFFTVTAWEKNAEKTAQYCKQGTLVGVTGRLVQEKYEKDGQTRRITKIEAISIDFLAQPQGNSRQEATPPAEPSQFANIGGASPHDPFASIGGQPVNDPFSNPFAGTGAAADPFANAAAGSASNDPFAGFGGIPASSNDPFAGFPGPSNDPFAAFDKK